MKVTCTNCSATIPAADVALDKGWAKCVRCDEVIPLAALLPGYSAAGGTSATERPFDAWAVVRREPKLLAIHLPAQGMRAAAWGGLLFAIFWLGFIAFWTAGALGAIGRAGGIQWENLTFAAFSIPFWLIGFGMLLGIVWIARGSRSVMIDSGQLVTEMRCLVWRRTRTFGRDQVQCARAGEQAPKQEYGRPTPVAEIIFTKGSFTLPCNSPAEQEWLVAEINGFLKSVPHDPAQRGWMSDTERVLQR